MLAQAPSQLRAQSYVNSHRAGAVAVELGIAVCTLPAACHSWSELRAAVAVSGQAALVSGTPALALWWQCTAGKGLGQCNPGLSSAVHSKMLVQPPAVRIGPLMASLSLTRRVKVWVEFGVFLALAKIIANCCSTLYVEQCYG